jgi:exosortase
MSGALGREECLMHPRPWRFLDGMLIVMLCALAIVAALPVWRDIVGTALESEEQSHILLAPAVAVWLGWLRRGRLRLCRPRWSYTGVAAVLAGWAMIAFGFSRSIDLAWHAGAILMLVGAGVSVVGIDVVRRFLPVVLTLLFLLPVPGQVRSQIAIPLQEATAAATQFVFDLIGVAVVRNGNVLSINGFDVAVAEACNGMRMVSALALVSFAFVFSVPMRTTARLVILLASPFIALLVNIVRLIPTVLVYGRHRDDPIATTFHDLSGWAALVLALALLWCILRLLRWLEIPIAPYAIKE